MTDSRAIEFIRLHDGGASFREIGLMYGISRERVRQILDASYPVEGRRRTAVQKKIDSLIPSDGVTAAQASEIMGCKKQSAYYRLRTRGVSYGKVMTGPGIDPDKIARYMRYSSENMTVADVASLEGISQPNVTRFCKKNGIKLRDGRRK